MPEYLTPGVYVEETTFRSRSIEGVATSTTGIAGLTRYGPVPHELPFPTTPPGRPLPPPAVKEPPLMTSFSEFERAFGGLDGVADGPNYTALAARAFFDNGGRRLYVARVFGWPRTDGNINFDGLFATQMVAADGNNLAEWRARWPGAAGERFRIFVRLRRSKNVIVPPSPNVAGSAARLRTVREFALVELAPLAEATTRPGDVALEPDTIRVVRRNAATGLLELEGPGGREPVPGDQAAFHLQLEVRVRWGDREDSYAELAVHPDHPRSIFTVLSREDPADEFGLVWLRWLGSAAPTTQQLQQLTPVLLTPDEGTLLVGGSDGEETSPETLEGDQANPDNQREVASGLNALGEIEDIAIVMAPDTARLTELEANQAAVDRVISHCERLRYRIAIVDPPQESSISEVRQFRSRFDTRYGALYYPWLEILDPTAVPDPGAPLPRLMVPPSGFVAGIYARNDIERGVFKAPANEVIRGITRFETNVTFDRQSVLNPEGINALRFFEGRSNRVWGARTMSSDPEWKYVNVRRLFIYLEHSIDRSTQWAVFEPNNERLWASIRQSIEDFLLVTWRSGALMGTRPEEAYFVRCDRTTMTQNDLDNGRLICLIGVAPTYPAEFVIFRIGQWTADARRS
jgi:phage tail sheath protein FI